MKAPVRMSVAALAVWGAALSALAEDPLRPLTLAEALSLSAHNNENVAIAAARVDRARELAREAYGSLLPSVTGQWAATRDLHRQDPINEINRNSSASSVTLDMAVLDVRALVVGKSFTRNLEAQRYDSAEIRRSLAFEVAQNFFAILSAEKLRDAARRRIEVAQAIVGEAQIKLDAGLASRNELTRSELELATARLSLTQSIDLVRTTRLNLGFLMGAEKEADRPLEEPEPLPQPAPAPMGVEEAAAVAARQDVRAQDLRTEALRLLAQEPGLRIVPTVGLRAQYKGNNASFLNTTRQSDYTLGAALTWSVFDGFRYPEAAARRALVRESAASAKQLRRHVGLEVRTARANIETAEGAFRQAQVRARVAAQNEEEVRVRFGQGLATALEQADATASAFEADSDLARTGFSVRISQLHLQQALGLWP
ncbi:MAG TPA: TolC family protein, partial [Thermoanaerobaculia bacterium]|nr:TolC family protein [Thermoanaerobaculia bacterium]